MRPPTRLGHASAGKGRPLLSAPMPKTLLATLFALLALAPPASAAAGARTHAPPTAVASAGVSAAAAERVAAYWTPQRMAAARPLDLVVDSSGEAEIRAGAAPGPGLAGASFKRVTTPDVPPYSFNGRIFLKRGNLKGFCSGTAINSPTRQLVLTAGHCVNSGPEDGHRAVWSNYIAFVPAYTGGVAPFGIFVARSDQVYAPKQWTKTGNPDFDLGAFLTRPNEEGVNVADAVGGGATIALGLPRAQQFLTFGYPGETQQMQGCQSPYIGDDTLTFSFSGPPTMAIRCRWAPGASGGGWLIGDGSQINGVNAYLHLDNKKRTFGPYFAEETVGKLVRGL
jgi:V8-like Glu-specific endopeptidase